MISFERSINKAEADSFYINLTDERGITYGKRFPKDKAKLWLITNQRKYKASKRGLNQIWGVARTWFEKENVNAGTRIRIRYNPEAEPIAGRVPIEIEIVRMSWWRTLLTKLRGRKE